MTIGELKKLIADVDDKYQMLFIPPFKGVDEDGEDVDSLDSLGYFNEVEIIHIGNIDVAEVVSY